MNNKPIICDVLVIGSGIAGLTLALKVARFAKVALVTKSRVDESATYYAQGGLAIVISPEDSFDEHIQDTLKAGCGLSKEEVVRLLVTEAPKRLEELVQSGVRFSKEKSIDRPDEQEFELGLEGGHSKRRILHVGDYTGQAVQTALVERRAALCDV